MISLLLILTFIQLFPGMLVKEIQWQVRKRDSLQHQFEISVPEVWPLRDFVLSAMANHLQVSIPGIPPSDYSSTVTFPRGATSIEVDLKFQKSFEVTDIYFSFAKKATFPITLNMNATMTPLDRSLKLSSYFMEDQSSAIFKYTSIALQSLTFLSGAIMMTNSVIRLNGVLLLKFAQILDFINFFALLNVNYRKNVADTLSQMYSVTQNNFIFFQVPLDFSSVTNAWPTYRSKLTDEKISPILLENQLLESFTLVGLHLLRWMMRPFEGGRMKKIFNFAEAIRFSFVQIILVEQFFYSAYQLVSRHNYEEFEPLNWVSWLCAFISVASIAYELSKVAAFAPIDRFRSLETQTKVTENTESPIKDLSHPSYVIEFVEADMNKEKLAVGLTRYYNLLFVLRFIVINMALITFQNYPKLQIGSILLYTISMLSITVKGACFAGIFSNKWVAFQRLLQEFFILAIFGVFGVFVIDTDYRFLTVASSQWLTAAFFCLLAGSLCSELIFFAINLIKSIIVALILFCKFAKKCCSKPAKPAPKQEKPQIRKLADEKIQPAITRKPVQKVSTIKKLSVSPKAAKGAAIQPDLASTDRKFDRQESLGCKHFEANRTKLAHLVKSAQI